LTAQVYQLDDADAAAESGARNLLRSIPATSGAARRACALRTGSLRGVMPPAHTDDRSAGGTTACRNGRPDFPLSGHLGPSPSWRAMAAMWRRL
jgi:hypothetical protein